MVNSQDGARVERAMRALAADGAAPIPDGLAARAFRAAVAQPQKTSSFDALVDALVAVARPGALAATAVALVVVLASAFVSSATSSTVAQAASDPLRALSAERFDVDTLVAERFGITSTTASSGRTTSTSTSTGKTVQP
jgi:hypothetical protein